MRREVRRYDPEVLALEIDLSVDKDSVTSECRVLTASSLRLEISKVRTQ